MCYNEGGIVEEIKRIDRADEDGHYEEVRMLRRRVLDPAILRTCKRLCADGSQILYGKNRFHFEVYNTTAPFLIGQGGVLHPRKYYRSIDPDTNAVQKQAPMRFQKLFPSEKVPEWVYSDMFTGLFCTIGPKNAAVIKSLRFIGSVIDARINSW
jgi:hypothetical protein